MSRKCMAQAWRQLTQKRRKQVGIFLLALNCVLILRSFVQIQEEARIGDTTLALAQSLRKNGRVFKARDEQFYVSIDGVRYPQVVPIYLNKSIDFEALNSNPKVKTILLKTSKLWQLDDFGFELGGRELFERYKCPVTNCEVTNDTRRLNQSDLVLVSFYNLNINWVNASFTAVYFLPPNRNERRDPAYAHQRWVYVNFESPAVLPLCNGQLYNGVFNLTSTYRLSSDYNTIHYGESQFEWKLNRSFDPTHNYHAAKSKLVVGLISKCASNSRRELLIEELGKFISVDIYGKCGKLECRSNASFDCREHLSRVYKFFLAFENSLCVEYITEKFFRTINFDIVPVVFGLGDYHKYIPRSGYINALDFDSPRELANYLLYLDRTPHVYNTFFRWKQYVHYYKFTPPTGWLDYTNTFASFCEMCIRLNLDDHVKHERKILSNISRMNDYQKECRSYSLVDQKNTLGAPLKNDC